MKSMLKVMLCSMLSIVLAAPVLEADSTPGKGNRFNTGKMKVVNQTDEAVLCQIASRDPVVLEPLQSTEAVFLLNRNSIEVQVTASLVSDSSISAQTSVKVGPDKTTTVTVTSRVSGSTVELQLSSKSTGNGASK